jgi:hypothetical protein
MNLYTREDNTKKILKTWANEKNIESIKLDMDFRLVFITPGWAM